MRSYSELNRRINPYWEEVMNLLIDDENQDLTPDVVDRNQVSHLDLDLTSIYGLRYKFKEVSLSALLIMYRKEY